MKQLYYTTGTKQLYYTNGMKQTLDKNIGQNIGQNKHWTENNCVQSSKKRPKFEKTSKVRKNVQSSKKRPKFEKTSKVRKNEQRNIFIRTIVITINI
jgi:hypothetical protein